MAVMIGVDPHKGSHTAVAVDRAEQALGELRVRSSEDQVQRLMSWAAQWPERTWAIEGAGGLGYLLAQQLVGAGETVLDVQPKLGARVRLLATGNVNKNDPNDARSVAVAALRSKDVPRVSLEDQAAVMKLWSKRRRDLGARAPRWPAACTRCSANSSPAAWPGKRYRQPRPPGPWGPWSRRGRWPRPVGSSLWTSSLTCAASTRKCSRPKSALKWLSKPPAPPSPRSSASGRTSLPP